MHIRPAKSARPAKSVKPAKTPTLSGAASPRLRLAAAVAVIALAAGTLPVAPALAQDSASPATTTETPATSTTSALPATPDTSAGETTIAPANSAPAADPATAQTPPGSASAAAIYPAQPDPQPTEPPANNPANNPADTTQPSTIPLAPGLAPQNLAETENPENPENPDNPDNPENPENTDETPGDIGPLSILGAITTVEYDGTATFDANSNPGNDQGPNNGIVRTNDEVQYKFEYNTDAAVTTPAITSTAPAGTQWVAVPPSCTGPGTAPHPSGIYDSTTGAAGGDRRLLVCQLPSTTQSVSDSILPRLRVTTALAQGASIPIGFSIDDASADPAIVSNVTTTTVSAAPFYDLRKLPRAATANVNGPNGEPGIVNSYPIAITVANQTRFGPVQGIKGMSQLENVVSFYDDLSAYSPNARLYDWAGTGCGYVNAGDIGGVPGSRIGATGSATATNSVPNSGTVACAPNGHGFDVSFTGIDTSASSFPTTNSQGVALGANYLFVATALVRVWLPQSDVINGADGIPGTGDDNSLLITNTVTQFDPDDTIGQSNYGTGSEALTTCFGRPTERCDNSTALTLAAGMGLSKQYRAYIGGGTPPGATGLWTGDLRAGTGYRVASRVSITPAVLPATNVRTCDIFDNTSQRLYRGPDANTNPARYGQSVSPDPILPGDYLIEYGAGTTQPGTFADMRAARCDDSDAIWSVTPTSATLGGNLTPNGFRDTIDRVRITFFRDLPPQTAYYLYTYLEVYGTSTLDPAQNPDGTILSNFGQFRYGATPVWNSGNTYNPVNHTGAAYGDRILFVPGEVRIAKTVREVIPGSGSQVLAGQDITFELQPSVSSLVGSAPGTMRDVVVTDILPTTSPRLTINPLTVTAPPGAVLEYCDQCTGSDWNTSPPDVTHGIRWNFGDVPADTAIPALTYQARVPITALNGQTYNNTTTITSPDDPSTPAERSSNASISVVAAATVLATKSAARPVEPLNSDLRWTLSMRNATGTPVNSLDVVDVLPAPGDGRTPPSAFSGDFSDVRVENLPDGLTAYISSSPTAGADPWPVTPGTGEWACTLAQLGSAGCPTAATITAVRFASAAGVADVLDPNETVSWNLVLTPTGNVTGDQYTNRYVARVNPEVLQLPVNSPDVPIRVVGPSVSLVKDVCLSDTCDVTDDSAWGQTTELPEGADAVYRLTVTNTGEEAGAVTVTDELPDGLDFVAGSAEASAGDVSGFDPEWVVGDLDPGQSESLLFRASGTDLGAVTNEASADIVDRFDQTASDTDDAEVTFVAVPISIVKTLESSAVDADGTGEITYLIAVTNESPFVGSYSLDDELRFGEGIVSDGASAVNEQPGTITVNPGWDGVADTSLTTDTSIPAGSTHTYRVTVGVGVPGGLPDAALTCTAQGTPGGFRNVASLLDTDPFVNGTACADAPAGSLAVEKTAAASVVAGGDLEWSITVRNTGALDAGALTVTDPLPDGVTFVSASGDGTAEGQVVSWRLDGLAAGESATLTVRGTVADDLAGSVLTNCATNGIPDGWVGGEGEPDVAAAGGVRAAGDGVAAAAVPANCAETAVNEPDGGSTPTPTPPGDGSGDGSGSGTGGSGSGGGGGLAITGGSDPAAGLLAVGALLAASLVLTLVGVSRRRASGVRGK